jgi:cystathionine gamma-synthase
VTLDRSVIWPHVDGEPDRFFYARYGHPTGEAAEEALAALEGGPALLFPSGSGAITALVLAFLEPGKTVAVAGDAYYGTAVLFGALERWGLRFLEFDQTGPPPDGVDLVWIEAPSNPLLTMPDFEAAVAHPAPVVCDATAATPLRLKPLSLGCDFALHSATKYLGGHHDLLLGAVACRSRDDHDRLRELRGRTGIVAGPDDAWLLLRSLPTLEVRLRRQEETARELVERLRRHPRVETVRYPGLGGMLSFDVAGGAGAAHRVETSTSVIANATSLGGVRSVLETRSRWEGDRVPPGLVRLSVGLEDVDALWADLEQSLASTTA